MRQKSSQSLRAVFQKDFRSLGVPQFASIGDVCGRPSATLGQCKSSSLVVEQRDEEHRSS